METEKAVTFTCWLDRCVRDWFSVRSVSSIVWAVISSASGPGIFYCNTITIEHWIQWVPLADHTTSVIACKCGNRRKRNKTAGASTMCRRAKDVDDSRVSDAQSIPDSNIIQEKWQRYMWFIFLSTCSSRPHLKWGKLCAVN